LKTAHYGNGRSVSGLDPRQVILPALVTDVAMEQPPMFLLFSESGLFRHVLGGVVILGSA